MNLNFSKVTYDGDLEDADEEQLRSLVAQYEDAQEANAAEFEDAKNAIEQFDEVDVSEYSDAKEDLIETIQEYDAFEESPTDVEDLEQADFSKLREWDAYFAEQSATEADDVEDEADEPEFDDMGQKAPTREEEDDSEFAERYLGDVPGVNF